MTVHRGAVHSHCSQSVLLTWHVCIVVKFPENMPGEGYRKDDAGSPDDPSGIVCSFCPEESMLDDLFAEVDTDFVVATLQTYLDEMNAKYGQ